MAIKIFPIPALKDNYIWLLRDTTSGNAIIVDPGEAEPVLKVLQEQQLKLTAILVTHAHSDHVAGIPELLNHTKVPVYGSLVDSLPFYSHLLQENDIIHLQKLDISFTVLQIPGHTLGHIAYYGLNSVFTGDTLFTGGCGRIFEGTAAQLYQSLNKLCQLPSETFVYCGHEYTEKNLLFAKEVESDNAALLERLKNVSLLREEQKPTVPASLALELQTNPFLRCFSRAVIQSVEKHCGKKLDSPLQVFAELRKWKDVVGTKKSNFDSP
jgi:hydroxyacylglutathione hydrolase